MDHGSNGSSSGTPPLPVKVKLKEWCATWIKTSSSSTKRTTNSRGMAACGSWLWAEGSCWKRKWGEEEEEDVCCHVIQWIVCRTLTEKASCRLTLKQSSSQWPSYIVRGHLKRCAVKQEECLQAKCSCGGERDGSGGGRYTVIDCWTFDRFTEKGANKRLVSARTLQQWQ
jgi:hypothetical protein